MDSTLQLSNKGKSYKSRSRFLHQVDELFLRGIFPQLHPHARLFGRMGGRVAAGGHQIVEGLSKVWGDEGGEANRGLGGEDEEERGAGVWGDLWRSETVGRVEWLSNKKPAILRVLGVFGCRGRASLGLRVQI